MCERSADKCAEVCQVLIILYFDKFYGKSYLIKGPAVWHNTLQQVSLFVKALFY